MVHLLFLSQRGSIRSQIAQGFARLLVSADEVDSENARLDDVLDEQAQDNEDGRGRQKKRRQDFAEEDSGVLPGCVLQEKGLPGILKHGDEKHHEDPQLVIGLVNADGRRTRQSQQNGAVDDLGDHRSEPGGDKGNPEPEERSEQISANPELQVLEDIGQQGEPGEDRGRQTGQKNGLDAHVEPKNKDDVERQVDDDIEGFDDGEFPGPVVETKPGKGHDRDGVEKQNAHDQEKN